jgi:hypothetical protein
MIGNLRGVRESGRLFAAPTYFFIVSILAMLAVGAWRYLTGRSSRPATRVARPARSAVSPRSARSRSCEPSRMAVRR